MDSPYETPKTNPLPERVKRVRDVGGVDEDKAELAGLAKASGALGLSSLFLVTAPVALVFSACAYVALREREKRTGVRNWTEMCWAGIVVGAVGSILFLWLLAPLMD